MSKNHNIIEIMAIFVHQTEKGFCVKNLKNKDVWLPKSQIEIEGNDKPNPGQEVNMQIPEWLALDKELI